MKRTIQYIGTILILSIGVVLSVASLADTIHGDSDKIYEVQGSGGGSPQGFLTDSAVSKETQTPDAASVASTTTTAAPTDSASVSANPVAMGSASSGSAASTGGGTGTVDNNSITQPFENEVPDSVKKEDGAKLVRTSAEGVQNGAPEKFYEMKPDGSKGAEVDPNSITNGEKLVMRSKTGDEFRVVANSQTATDFYQNATMKGNGQHFEPLSRIEPGAKILGFDVIGASAKGEKLGMDPNAGIMQYATGASKQNDGDSLANGNLDQWAVVVTTGRDGKGKAFLDAGTGKMGGGATEQGRMQ